MEFYWINGVIAALLSFILINVYFYLAIKYKIIDVPNHRSSHDIVTIRGGGIIVPLMFIIYEIISGIPQLYFTLGLLLISLVSFWDDIHSISSKKRLIVQFVSVILFSLQLNIEYSWWLFFILPLVIGFINGYNFMDGINGITGLYSLLTVSTLLVVNEFIYSFTDRILMLFIIIPIIVFLYYNFRRRAKCFAGDVGSISISFILLFLLIKLINETQNLYFTMFFVVYLIDIAGTIIHRIFLHQNIFEAHRMHLYQLLVNNKKISHIKVSIIYSSIQLIINMIVISTIDSSIFLKYGVAFLFILSLAIIYIKMRTTLYNK